MTDPAPLTESVRSERWTVRAEWPDGGKALVVMEDGAASEGIAGEVRAYLDRGAATVVVERAIGEPL